MARKTIPQTSREISTELKSSLDFKRTLTDKLSLIFIDILGSMRFLIACLLFFTTWICWNLHFIPALKPFDPFPFPILDMTVSIFAIILSVTVIINQNRQGKIEKIRQQVEFEINVRAEDEITRILKMVHELHQNAGLTSSTDNELEQMKETINIKEIHQTIDEKERGETVPDDEKAD